MINKWSVPVAIGAWNETAWAVKIGVGRCGVGGCVQRERKKGKGKGERRKENGGGHGNWDGDGGWGVDNNRFNICQRRNCGLGSSTLLYSSQGFEDHHSSFTPWSDFLLLSLLPFSFFSLYSLIHVFIYKYIEGFTPLFPQRFLFYYCLLY